METGAVNAHSDAVDRPVDERVVRRRSTEALGEERPPVEGARAAHGLDGDHRGCRQNTGKQTEDSRPPQ